MNDEYDELGQDEGQGQEQPQQEDRYSPKNKSSNPEAKKHMAKEAANAEAKRRAKEKLKQEIAKQVAKQVAKRGTQAAAGSASAGTAAVAIEVADQVYQFVRNPREYARKWRKRLLLILLAIFIFIVLVTVIIAAIFLGIQDTKGISINKTGPEAVKNGEDIKYQISLTSGGGGDAGGNAAACGQKSTPPGGGEKVTCSGPYIKDKPPSGYYKPTYFGCNVGYKDKGDNCQPGCGKDKFPECKGLSDQACEEKIAYYSANAAAYSCGAKLKITNPSTGQAVIVMAIDNGPACSVQNEKFPRFDLSKFAYDAIKANDVVKVEPVDAGTKLGPVTSCGAGDAGAPGGAAPAGGAPGAPGGGAPGQQAAPAGGKKKTMNYSPVAFSKFYDNMYMGRAVLQAATGPGAQNASTSGNTASNSATTDSGGGGAASWELVVRPNEPDTYVLNIARVMVFGDMAYAIDTIPENATFISATGEYETTPPGGGPGTRTVMWKVPVASIPGGSGGGGPVSVGNLTMPPGAQEVGQGYYRLPESKDGSYHLLGSCNTGSKELLSLIYTVAQAWKQKYPQGRINVGDLNAPGHLSHKNGVDVDLEATSDGKDCVADMSASGLKGSRNCGGSVYKRDKTIELGKMFMGTGIVKLMFYNDAAARSGIGGPIQQWPNHENHFHIRIKTNPLPSKGC